MHTDLLPHHHGEEEHHNIDQIRAQGGIVFPADA